jgi:hypothetical protein
LAQFGIAGGVLDGATPEPILNRPRVVGQKPKKSCLRYRHALSRDPRQVERVVQLKLDPMAERCSSERHRVPLLGFAASAR